MVLVAREPAARVVAECDEAPRQVGDLGDERRPAGALERVDLAGRIGDGEREALRIELERGAVVGTAGGSVMRVMSGGNVTLTRIYSRLSERR